MVFDLVQLQQQSLVLRHFPQIGAEHQVVLEDVEDLEEGTVSFENGEKLVSEDDLGILAGTELLEEHFPELLSLLLGLGLFLLDFLEDLHEEELPDLFFGEEVFLFRKQNELEQEVDFLIAESLEDYFHEQNQLSELQVGLALAQELKQFLADELVRRKAHFIQEILELFTVHFLLSLCQSQVHAVESRQLFVADSQSMVDLSERREIEGHLLLAIFGLSLTQHYLLGCFSLPIFL